MTVEELRKLSKNEVLEFIRQTLILAASINGYRDKYRFDMSGYDYYTGNCTVLNMEIINFFAYLGIYDYTDYLFLDFHKGSGTLFFRYCGEDHQQLDLTGEGTTNIIYKILKITVFSGKYRRRRI